MPSPSSNDITREALISAGFTGCLPVNNEISNLTPYASGRTWNATCYGKSYLCLEFYNANSISSFNCAPVAKES